MRVSVADFWGLTLIQEHSSAPLSRGQEVRLGPLPPFGRLPNSGRSFTLRRAQERRAALGRERNQNAAGCPQFAHGMPETLLCMLPARQADSSMVESQEQTNGHSAMGQVILNQRQGRMDLSGNGCRMWLRPKDGKN